MPVLYDQIRAVMFARGLGQDYGRYLSLQCPWHDDHSPSLRCYPDYYVCDGCQEQGRNLFTLLEALQGANRRSNLSAVHGWQIHLPPYHALGDLKQLADDAHKAMRQFSGLRYYLSVRRIDSKFETCHLGWHEGWITIPIYSPDQRFVGLVLRATEQVQTHTGQRFMTPLGQPPLCYCPNWMRLETARYGYIVFGMFDAISLEVMEIPVVTSTGGKDSFDPTWLDRYRYPWVTLADRKEETSALRQRLMSGLDWRGQTMRLDYPEGVKDPNDWMRLDPVEFKQLLTGKFSDGQDTASARKGTKQAVQRRPARRPQVRPRQS